jgi:hypothetical protein
MSSMVQTVDPLSAASPPLPLPLLLLPPPLLLLLLLELASAVCVGVELAKQAGIKNAGSAAKATAAVDTPKRTIIWIFTSAPLSLKKSRSDEDASGFYTRIAPTAAQ